jgi:chromosome segregation ATPase
VLCCAELLHRCAAVHCVRYALRNTLVAKDLEQASRIAYGARDRRFARVVTVAGQLIAGGCDAVGAFFVDNQNTPDCSK